MRTQWFRMLPICASARALYAQTFGGITGEVRDAQGATVPAAEVTLINAETNVSRKTVTNEEGLYSFPSVPPGRYDVRVTKAGLQIGRPKRRRDPGPAERPHRFRTAARPGIANRSRYRRRPRCCPPKTRPSAPSSKTSGSSSCRSTAATTCSWCRCRRTSATVSAAPARRARGRAATAPTRTSRSAGQRSNFNNFTLDGVNNTDPNFNTYVVLPSIDALQEFKVQTGVYPAEFGRQATQINVSTKSGQQRLSRHAVRVPAQRQAGCQATTRSPPARPPKDPFKWNQYGFTLGGPVRIPKLFNGREQAVLHGELRGVPAAPAGAGDSTACRPSAMRTGNFSELPGRRVHLRSQHPRRECRRHGHGDALSRQHHSRQPHRSDARRSCWSSIPAPNLPNAALCATTTRSVAGPPDQQGPVHAPHGLRRIVQIAVVRPL